MASPHLEALPSRGPRARGLLLASVSAFALTAAAASPALAVEPWSDADPNSEWDRHAVGEFGVRAGAEYRAQWMTVDPIAVNSVTGRRVSWIEHRLRLDGAVDYKDKVKVVTSADLLDGVLWGDNGDLGTVPAPNSGTNVNARVPNTARPCVGYRGGDLIQAESYGYTLCSQDAIKFRKLYGEVALPFGVFRIGRQATNIGTTVQAADADGRPNRFGISRTGNVVDRILFATKPLEALKPERERNTTDKQGVIVAATYDRWVTDSVHLFGDDVHSVNTAVRWLEPKHALGSDMLVSGYYSHRWDAQYVTRINTLGLRAMSRFGPIHAGFDMATNFGSTREVAEAYKLITNDPVEDQTIRQFGARAVVRYDGGSKQAIAAGRPTWSLYFETDYASGDEDPNIRTPLTQLTFPEDANVGLLLFEHVLGFQTARASAAGVEVLRRLGAKSFPAEAVSTRGSFTNAFAVFPQVDFRPHPTLLLRGGVLVAWAPERVVDPVASLQARDGLTIDDDLVNFVGGKPARYYGTEIDARIQWRYLEHFIVDVEGALLFPGEALQNADGEAVRSGLLQGRTTFYF